MTAEEVIEMFRAAKFCARHGDVVIVSDAKQKPPPAVDCAGVVAEGEVTGHAHRVNHGEVRRIVDDLIHRTIVAHENATIDHEEHQQKPVPGGCAQDGRIAYRRRGSRRPWLRRRLIRRGTE